MDEKDRQEVREIAERVIMDKLRSLNLENLFEILNREHNMMNGTHKEIISTYVQYDDIQGAP